MYYELELHHHFPEKQTVITSIDELAEIWQCSSRYAKTIVHRLAEQQIILWETFRGRGKKPNLTLNRSKFDAIFDIFKMYWQQEHFEKAYGLLIENQLMNHPLVDRWMLAQYGLQQLQTKEHIFRQPYYKIDVTFDPIQLLSRHDFHFAAQLHETLFTFNDETNQPEKNLLFHYETKDYKTWRFILRKDVYFHNHELLVANDVKRSLERAEKLTNRFFTYKQIEVIHPFELCITLTKSFPLLPNCLASVVTAILPEHHHQGTVGCGAFQLKTANAQKLQFQVFPRYFKQRPWIDGIEIIYTNNTSNSGISSIPFPPDIPSSTMIFEEHGAKFISLNARHGPLVDVAYRETIYSLLHAEDYIIKDWGEIIAHSWYYGQENLKGQSDSHILAEQFPVLKIGVQQIRTGVNHEPEALILQQILAQYGITSTIHIVDFKKSQTPIQEHFDLFVGGYALGQDTLLSLIALYNGTPNTTICMAPVDIQQHFFSLLEKDMNTEQIRATLELLEQQLQHSFCLKFLTHRTHRHYIRDSIPYKGIQFDNNGRIDYKRIYS